MQEEIRIDVLKIADIYFAAHEEYIDIKQKQYQYQLEHQVGFNVPSNLINIKFRIFYTYADKNERLLDIIVENVFVIENLIKYIPVPNGAVTPENMNIPSEALVNMTAMCISHTRALLCKNKGTTYFSAVNPPHLDAKAVARNFFGDKITD